MPQAKLISHRGAAFRYGPPKRVGTKATSRLVDLPAHCLETDALFCAGVAGFFGEMQMLARIMGAISGGACIMSLCGVALGAANSETALFSSTQFREATAKIEGGIKSYTSPAGAEAMASAMRRDVDRTVEFHLKQHDPVIPQGGHANALVGGHIDGNMQTAPVEYRGGIIAGGVKYRLTPGDVPWIPAGTPHQMLIEKGGSFNYLALKFDAQVAKPK